MSWFARSATERLTQTFTLRYLLPEKSEVRLGIARQLAMRFVDELSADPA